jgi:hypothetical protein
MLTQHVMTMSLSLSSCAYDLRYRTKGGNPNPRVSSYWDINMRLCQCFMETCIGDLAKAYTNKAYQEKEERYNIKNENQCIL